MVVGLVKGDGYFYLTTNLACIPYHQYLSLQYCSSSSLNSAINLMIFYITAATAIDCIEPFVANGYSYLNILILFIFS